MTEAEILDLVHEALAYAAPARARAIGHLTPDNTLSSLGIDSIVALEMAGYIEETHSLHFPDDELARVSSIRGLVDLIQRLALSAA